MGLTDELTAVDEYIWKQHEKVTVKANKELGWNKYDLARMTLSIAEVSTLGVGVYLGIGGMISDAPLAIALGSSLTVSSLFSYHLSKENLNQAEKVETEFLRSKAAPQQPQFSAFRPLKVGVGMYLLTRASFIFYESTDFFSTNNENNSLGGIITSLLSSMILSNVASSYFRDQIMTPPTKKKPFWKTMYEKTVGKIKPAPQPQTEPTKYNSLEEVIGA